MTPFLCMNAVDGEQIGIPLSDVRLVIEAEGLSGISTIIWFDHNRDCLDKTDVVSNVATVVEAINKLLANIVYS